MKTYLGELNLDTKEKGEIDKVLREVLSKFSYSLEPINGSEKKVIVVKEEIDMARAIKLYSEICMKLKS